MTQTNWTARTHLVAQRRHAARPEALAPLAGGLHAGVQLGSHGGGATVLRARENDLGTQRDACGQAARACDCAEFLALFLAQGQFDDRRPRLIPQSYR